MALMDRSPSLKIGSRLASCHQTKIFEGLSGLFCDFSSCLDLTPYQGWVVRPLMDLFVFWQTTQYLPQLVGDHSGMSKYNWQHSCFDMVNVVQLCLMLGETWILGKGLSLTTVDGLAKHCANSALNFWVGQMMIAKVKYPRQLKINLVFVFASAVEMGVLFDSQKNLWNLAICSVAGSNVGRYGTFLCLKYLSSHLIVTDKYTGNC